jgi:hypothetical protein
MQTVPRPALFPTMTSSALPGTVILVELADQAHRPFHPACYFKDRDKGHEPDTGRVVRVTQQHACAHCYSCGGQLWEAAATCAFHAPDPCPTTSWQATRTFQMFACVWCGMNGWELCDDTMDVVDIVLNEPNAPDCIEELVDRTRFILDRTA